MLIELAAQVRSVRNVLANIGGNVNDISKHANSTHELDTIRLQAETALPMARRLVGRADEELGEVAGIGIVIATVVQPYGWRPDGLIAYRFGPGRYEEHRNPRVVAAWDGAPGFHRLRDLL